MCRQCIHKYGLVSLVFLVLFLSCGENLTNPYDPVNTKISAVLRSSSLTILNESAYTDTTGGLIRIGVASNLPLNIDSINIIIHTAHKIGDTAKTFKGVDTLKTADTSWWSYVLKDEGNSTIAIDAFIKNGKKLSVTFQVIVYPRAVNHRPKLSVTGKDSIIGGGLCSLYVTAIDMDSLQTLAYSIVIKPFGATFNPPFFKWQTTLNSSAIDTVVFVVTDNGYPPLTDTQKINITVYTPNVNKPPKWGKDTINQVGLTGTAITLSLSDKCTDPDGDTIAFSLLPGLPDNDTIKGASYFFTPSAKDTGSSYPQIVAKDPKGGSDTLTLHLSISSANKKPVFKTDMPKSFYSVNEGAFLSIPLGASDADNDSVFFFVQSSSTTLPRASTITVTNDTLSWQSQTSDTGNFKLGIGVTDKKDTVFIVVNVSIGNINHPPMWLHRLIQAEVQEGKTLTMLLSDSCTDPDADIIQYSLLPGVPASDSIINLNRYTYSPSYSDSGSYTIKISASDGKLSDTLTIKLHVANVNRSPIIAGVKDTTIVQGASIDFLVTATDPDSDKVTLSTTGALPSGATFNAATGAFHWVPASTVTGGTDITFSASDGMLTASKKITITISSMPPPSITKDPVGGTVCPGQTDTFSVTATGTGTLGYQWKKGDTTLANATSAVLILSSVTPGDSGQYMCVVSNVGGKTTSKAAKLTVNTLSTTPTGSANPATIHFGDSTVLSVNTGTLGTGASWLWYSGSCGGTAVSSGASIKVSPATSTSYFVRAEGGCVTTNCSAAIPVTIQFTVTFESQGGGAVSLQNVNSGAKATTPTTPTQTGYAFGGWYKEAACTNVWTFATDIVTSNITLYAKWVAIMDTVTFNSNGGTAVALKLVAYNGTISAPNPAPTKSGNVFAGWCSDASLANAFVFTAPITTSITLYAKWTPIYTVTYDGNGKTGGSVPIDANIYSNGAIVTVLDNTGNLSRTNFAFAGWNTSSGGTGTQRGPGSTFQMGSTNIILYAVWSPVYTVTFNGQGATVGPNPGTKTVTVPATTVGTLPTPPTKTSYVFAGWWTAQNGGGTEFTSSTTVTSTIPVYAKWVIKDADGNIYTEVTIGTQIWMIENLKTTKYKDNSEIPLLGTNDWYGWYNDDIANKAVYGALYSWNAVKTGKLAPEGWHVPTKAECDTLISFLGGTDGAGGKLKEGGSAHWASPNVGATDDFGFKALPGGAYIGNNIGQSGMWWTSTLMDEFHSLSWGFLIQNTLTDVQFHEYNWSSGFSVRCVRDY